MEPMNDIVSFLPKLTKLAGIIMLPATFIVILLNTGNVKHKKKLNGIEIGLKKFGGIHADPFLAILRGTGTARNIGLPLPSITCSGAHHALVTPSNYIFTGNCAEQVKQIGNAVPPGFARALLSSRCENN